MKENLELESIVHFFKPDEIISTIRPIGQGLINYSYFVQAKSAYLLQRVNTEVFKKPEVIDKNTGLIADFLLKNQPEYLFIRPVKNAAGSSLAKLESGCWRLSPFIENTYSPDVLNSEKEAFEAAKAFGKLTRYLNNVDINLFEESIPDFHSLSFRYEQFKEAIQHGNAERKTIAQELIDFYQHHAHLVQTFSKIRQENLLPKRIQHHDTKINNVLFDQDTKKAKALCDLDTLMPGYIISDLGDMVRTYTSQENEESTNWEDVKIRVPYFQALMQGYLSQTSSILTETEKAHLFYAGQFMIYMQGLRFLSDYLLNDSYYPIKYENHNFNRAKNQMFLLQDLLNKRSQLQNIIDDLL